MHRESRVTSCAQARPLRRARGASSRPGPLQACLLAARRAGRCSTGAAAHAAALALADSHCRRAGAGRARTCAARRLRHAPPARGLSLCRSPYRRCARRRRCARCGARTRKSTPAMRRWRWTRARCRWAAATSWPRWPPSRPRRTARLPRTRGAARSRRLRSGRFFLGVRLRSQGARAPHQPGLPCARAVWAGRRRRARWARPPHLSVWGSARARRRLPALVAPALEPELQAVLARLAAAFPPVAACLAASGDGAACASPVPGGADAGAHLGAGGDAGSDGEDDGAPRAPRARVVSASAGCADAGAPVATARPPAPPAAAGALGRTPRWRGVWQRQRSWLRMHRPRCTVPHRVGSTLPAGVTATLPAGPPGLAPARASAKQGVLAAAPSLQRGSRGGR
jgi:hypothetical protein